MKDKVFRLIEIHPTLHKKDITKFLKIEGYKLDYIIRDLIKENKIERYYQKENDIRYRPIKNKGDI